MQVDHKTQATEVSSRLFSVVLTKQSRHGASLGMTF